MLPKSKPKNGAEEEDFEVNGELEKEGKSGNDGMGSGSQEN